jgi:acetyl esterase/lipase
VVHEDHTRRGARRGTLRPYSVAGLLAIVLLLATTGLSGCGNERNDMDDRLTIGIGNSVRYGDQPEQRGELLLADGDGPFPVVVFVHGGFWRNTYDLTLAGPQALDAQSRGYATWNIEYRRVGDPGGGYPGTLEDVGAAIDALARIDAPLDLDRVAVVGHSAGGHLALWVGQRDNPVVVPRLVVGQAPVADLEAALELSGGAVVDFMGGRPEQRPDAYAEADPARRLPIKVPQLIVIGTADDTVPLSVVEPYLAAAGSGLDVEIVDGVDHFDVIDPSSPTWDLVMDRIAAAFKR